MNTAVKRSSSYVSSLISLDFDVTFSDKIEKNGQIVLMLPLTEFIIDINNPLSCKMRLFNDVLQNLPCTLAAQDSSFLTINFTEFCDGGNAYCPSNSEMKF